MLLQYNSNIYTLLCFDDKFKIICFTFQLIKFVFGLIFKDQTRRDVISVRSMGSYGCPFIFVRFETNR